MKTRNGFVSNSSTSSFIIAVPPNVPECKCCKRSDAWMLQAITHYLTSLSKENTTFRNLDTTEAVLEFYERELDELKQSKSYAEKQLKTLVEFEKDPTAYKTYIIVQNQLDKIKRKGSITSESIYDSGATDESTIIERLTERKNSVESHLTNYNAKFEEIQVLIAKIKKYHKMKYSVYSFTMDNWATKTEQAIKNMIGSGVVVVIQQINT